jgi:superoxide dismutase, Cu-Zn family
MKRIIFALIPLLLVLLAACNRAPYPVTVPINFTTPAGIGEEIGNITAEDTQYGVLLTPTLAGLPEGIHGFHVHENPICSSGDKDGSVVPGLAAGGHYDPDKVGNHQGPYSNGHLGDLPPLIVTADGTASLPVLAPRLTVSDFSGRSFMIHAGGDNYADTPEPLGGGGARIACGAIE